MNLAAQLGPHHIFLLVCTCLGACRSDAIEQAATLGWTFNYRNWLKPSCAADNPSADCTDDALRTCDNESAIGYEPVTKIKVFVQDKNQDSAPFDREFSCADGFGEKRVPLRGIGSRLYTLRIEATAADDTVLYRYTDNNYDLLQTRSDSFELQAATGELSFFPAYAGLGVFECPVADTLSYNILSEDNKTVLATGSAPTCAEARPVRVVIRHVPVVPIAVDGSFLPNNYTLQLLATQGAQVDYCDSAEWTVRPGMSTSINPSLETGNRCF